jgi:acetolactate synthase-1/2/3 large subunit
MQTTSPTVASALVELLSQLGVEHAFGVSGGAMAVLWDALSAGPIAVHHCRHESGAAFAATEASLASGRPVLVFTTTGPGLTNALTGMLAARGEGARVVLVSAYSPRRFAIQETWRDTLPLYDAGALFHHASVVEDPAQLAGVACALATGFARPGGFVAHVALDTAAQRAA